MLPQPIESAQYTSIKFTDTLVREGLTASIGSVGSVGDAYDNAAAETVMGLYKNEAIAQGSPFRVGPHRSLEDVEVLTLEWVDWCNNRRLHTGLGNMPPEEYEDTYYAQNIGPLNDEATNITTA